MRIVVQKYGGSSLSTVDKLKEVAAKIVATRREGYGVVVVVSAMGNSTDDLLALARQVSPSPPKRELDMLLSAGERISMSLMSAAIADLGEEAISFTGSQCGIVTTDSHSNARIIDVRPFRVQDELARGRIVIVAGYQGTSYRREITTLGRGGSDTTAVALAAALGAEHCSIYSDVAGIYSADPRKVPSAQRLDEISYEEMQEFARLGARVMNAQAVEFARRRQISIWAKSTFGGTEGTQIHRVDGFPDVQLKEVRAAGVRGVACTSDTLQASVANVDDATALLEKIEAHELLAFRVDSAGAHALMSGENVADSGEFCRQLTDAGVVVTPVSTVSVVGLGVGTSADAITRVRGALAKAEVASLGMNAGGASIINVIPPGMEERAMNALHIEFLG
ncbi:MAG: aspartate kinase [Bradymonadia bacterium]|jgi:aspartate kinase